MLLLFYQHSNMPDLFTVSSEQTYVTCLSLYQNGLVSMTRTKAWPGLKVIRYQRQADGRCPHNTH
jgi:hypothetical protein